MTGTSDLRERVCIVTGATSGIGTETAKALADMGATVVLAVRDTQRGERVRAKMVEETGNERVDVTHLDLASLASVRAFATNFMEKHDRLHVLVNNAGLHTARRERTEDGFEKTFQVNHLGHFLLTNLLLGVLKQSAPARIVNVASEAHRYARMNLDDLNSEKRWSGILAYNQSKLANVMFTFALARRLEGTGVTANAVHPGVVRTRWARGPQSGIFRWGVTLAAPFMLSPEQGARTSIYVASSPEVEGISGKYFVRCKSRTPSREARNEEKQERLWELSEGMVEPFLAP